MADSIEERGQRAGGDVRTRRGPRIRLVTAGRVRAALAVAPRLLLLFVILWAFTGPIDRVPMIVGAAALPPAAAPADSTVRAAPVAQETGFAVASGPISTYFAARGGVRTFGPPISNAFPLLGSTVQLFRNHMLKVEPNGSVTTVNLFALGAIPFRNVGGRVIPDVDPYLVATAPVAGTPDYGARVQAFIQETVPDQWENMPVGFYQAFLGTVRAEEALPSGGEKALLAGFAQEVWGLPVSRPTRDAQDPNVVLLRWERGVMVWSRSTGNVTAVPLGETFRQVLTGDGLGPERTAAAAGSQFLMQVKTAAPNGVARPEDLPNTVLASAFSAGNPAINAAQLADYGTPTPTSTTVAPIGQTNPPPPPPPPPGVGTPTPTLVGAVGAGALPPPPGPAVGAASPAAAAAPAGSDPCYGDEQITFSPAEPRVNNEMLIAVTSSRPHPYGRLAGTEKTTFVRERPGQLGYVWEWTVALSYPGKQSTRSTWTRRSPVSRSRSRSARRCPPRR